eukprot:Tbor_TRINITY_DN5630_c4_g2::TRINITY_DN5630_c4_g2_i1::g.8407::m.8407
MFRIIPKSATKAAYTSLIRQTPMRTYFYHNAGEVGIWGSTMYTLLIYMSTFFSLAVGYTFYKLCFSHSNYNQFMSATSDLWEDDGTVMEGEEAVANLRIYRERIMPFMDEYAEKIEAAK